MNKTPETIWICYDDDYDAEITSDADPFAVEYVRADVVEGQLAAERERADALAAHVAAIKSDWAKMQGAKGDPVTALFCLRDTIGAAPETGLAQHDARVAAAERERIKGLAKTVRHPWSDEALRAVPLELIDEIAAGGGHES